jgi:glycerol kinase
MDLKKCKWDEDLRKLFGIPAEMLPEIFPSAVEYGRTKGFLDIPDGTPVSGMIGDQQSALFGQACFEKGSAKCTYGYGRFCGFKHWRQTRVF